MPTRSWICMTAIGALAWACGGAGGSAGGGGASAGGGNAGDPYAARRICEAECRRSYRCGRPDPSCPQRCPTLPVRNPPIYAVAFVDRMVACADTPDCRHDQDEQCILDLLVRAPPTSSASACSELSGGAAASARALRTCGIYKGLTPGTDAAALACLRTQRAPDRCSPPSDWK